MEVEILLCKLERYANVCTERFQNNTVNTNTPKFQFMLCGRNKGNDLEQFQWECSMLPLHSNAFKTNSLSYVY